MDRNLPANRPEDAPADTDHRPPVAADRPLSVAFLPLALITFIILAFTIAAWTFLSSAL
ncbi:MAG TPA: hypothetical protein VHP64_06360 [Candidatus Limnocylindria bacterium]|jgi:hypothetical protein|nr:hypothetical protein [Candidatus Limnocylindria bacterium]